MLPQLLIITGPTASGKSSLALEVSRAVDGEIVSADSLQIYRGMDIGTAKPSHADRDAVPHHLLDIANPDQQFTAYDFALKAASAIESIINRGKRPVLAGGTGLYIRALTRGLIDAPAGGGALREQLMKYADKHGKEELHRWLSRVDPVSASKTHPNNVVRVARALEHFEMTGVPFSSLHDSHGFPGGAYDVMRIAIQKERDVLDANIHRRVDHMMRVGLEDEARALLSHGYGRELKPMKSIGYREMCAFIAGEISYSQAVEDIKTHTRQYARRQLTWIKSEPSTIWVAYPENSATILEKSVEFFENRGITHVKSTV